METVFVLCLVIWMAVGGPTTQSVIIPDEQSCISAAEHISDVLKQNPDVKGVSWLCAQANEKDAVSSDPATAPTL